MRAWMCIALLASACSGATETDRDAVLTEWLQRDNAVWMARRSELLPGKYRRMAEDPYDFMRGTAGLFHEDLQRLSLPQDDLGYATTADAASVLILGDPHPENLSSFLAEDSPGPPTAGSIAVAWADMDAAAHGPWISDVRRGAQGLLLFIEDMQGCEQACREDAVRAFGGGYDAAIRASAAGDATFRLEGDLLANAFVADLVAEAAEEGAERKRLRDNTEITDGHRRLRVLDALPEGGSGLLAPDGRERVVAERVLADLSAQERAEGRILRVLDVARRYGQGVSSWPATRFVVLWDTGDPGPEDDRLCNLRELVDPPVYAGPGRPASAPWGSNAERLVFASRTLWPDPRLDPRLGAVVDGPTSWKILSWSSWFQGLDHGRSADLWNSGDADAEDLRIFARSVGAALALAHARGSTAAGSSAVDAIMEDLGEDPAQLGEALVPVSLAARERTLDDHARFVRLLDALGPWMGADLYAELP